MPGRPEFKTLAALNQFLTEQDVDWVVEHSEKIVSTAREGHEGNGKGVVVIDGRYGVAPDIFYMDRGEALTGLAYATHWLKPGVEITDRLITQLLSLEKRLDRFRDYLELYDPTKEFVLFILKDVDGTMPLVLPFPEE